MQVHALIPIDKCCVEKNGLALWGYTSGGKSVVSPYALVGDFNHMFWLRIIPYRASAIQLFKIAAATNVFSEP